MNDITKLLKSAKSIDFEIGDNEAFLNFAKRLNLWLHSSKNPLKGLPEKFYIVSGITDAFNQLYGVYNKIGIFEGEYGYHSLAIADRLVTDLSASDAIVISHPFSADGMSSHDKLAYADTLNKPIFVDCAFYGICDNISFDFSSYKNIHSVCFSLSKSLGTGRHRVGLLYTIDKFPVTIYDKWHYNLFSSAEYHYDKLNNITPDSISSQYKDQQLTHCKTLGLTPSDTVIFGLDYSDRYSDFRRSYVNRVCLTDLFLKVSNV